MNFLRQPIFYQAINSNYLRNIGCSRQLMKNSKNVSASIRPFNISNNLPMNGGISTATTTIPSFDQRKFSTKSVLKHAILKLFGLTDDSKSVICIRSSQLFEMTIRQINFSEFQTKFELPNTFNTWFLITELHIWMLSVRAMADGEYGEVIRNTIIETMWSDVNYRAKKLAPSKSSLIKKNVEELSGQFQYAMIAYDEGLMTNDMRLASALWERFFNRNSDNFDQIELLVKYVRMNIQMLDNMGRDDLLKKHNLKWISLKDCEKII